MGSPERWSPIREPAAAGGDPDPYPGNTRRDVAPCTTAANLDPSSRFDGPHRGHGIPGHRWCPGAPISPADQGR